MSKVKEYKKMRFVNATLLMQSLDKPYSASGKPEDAKYSITILVDKDDPNIKTLIAEYEEGTKDANKKEDPPFRIIKENKKDKRPKIGIGHYQLKANQNVAKGRPVIRDKYNRVYPNTTVPQFKSVVHLGITYGIYESNGKNGLGVWIDGIMVKDLVTYDQASLFADLAEQLPPGEPESLIDEPVNSEQESTAKTEDPTFI